MAMRLDEKPPQLLNYAFACHAAGGWRNGSAPRLHRGGYRFESYTAHHYPSVFREIR
jgi:hypothetical protein